MGNHLNEILSAVWSDEIPFALLMLASPCGLGIRITSCNSVFVVFVDGENIFTL